MAARTLGKDSAAIRDQLGNDPDVIQIPQFNYNQTIQIIELSAVISGQSLGESWIVGSATNGIVGTNTDTESGLQQVVGGSGRGQAVVRIVNPNNTYREFFGDTDFQDSSERNTADWDTTNLRLAMYSSNSHQQVYNTVATFDTIFMNSETVTKVTVDAIETKWGNDEVRYFVRTSKNVDWEEATKGLELILNNPGTILKVMVIFVGQGGSDTYIEELKVNYS